LAARGSNAVVSPFTRKPTGESPAVAPVQEAQQNGCVSPKSWLFHTQPGGCVCHIELNAPVSRVWRALTDYREFGSWFRVRLDGPFVPGQVTRGQITYPGYEHIRFAAVVQKIEPERLFSFTWHPYAVDPDEDYSAEAPTLVEFTLEKSARGTLLRVVESGFDKLPSKRRLEAFRMNEAGWDEQLGNISRHLAHAA
jgi:uncharacterized protein YndB with AHSA1/START domain